MINKKSETKVKKTEAKVEKKSTVSTKTAASKSVSASASVAASPAPKASGLSVPVYSLLGKASESLTLPKEIFGAKVNNSLLAQVARVYLNNQKGHWSHTKTRGEITASTRKIYRQKGTGRARHGSVSAPIFRHGGVALGPKSRNVVLELPKKMKRAALISSLSKKVEDKGIVALAGLEKASGKTKEMVKLMNQLSENKKMNVLIIAGDNILSAQRAIRNIEGVNFLSVSQLNAFEVIRHKDLILTKDAIEGLQKRLLQRSDKNA